MYYWKNRLFAASVIYLIPLSLVAVIPGLYMAYITDLKPLIAIDAISIGIILSVAFVPGIKVFTRKLLFNGVLYLASFGLLYYLGSNGPGLLYLMGITIFILLSLDQKYGFIALGLNTLCCIYFALAIYYGFASEAILSEYRMDTWIAVSTNLVFLSGTAVLLIPILFKGLQSAFEEQDLLREKLEESVDDLNAKNDELERFAYTVSHDLKEPLRMVSSFMGLLKKKYAGELDEKAQTYIHYAVDGAARMSDSIDDLLEYSRIGRKYTTIQKVDFNELVDEVLLNLQTDIKEQKADIEVGQLPTLNVVPIAIKKLFQNLISNALKYHSGDNPPQIVIRAEEQETCWRFAVSDNGIGIDPEHHERIFSVFKRLHTREEYPGNGMGLSICKKIVAQHNGEIWVESEKGKGSIFYFTITK